MKTKSVVNLFKQTFKEFGEDKVLRLSAAMAYYAIFSIGPLLILIVSLAGLVFGEETVRKEVTAQIQGMVGEKSMKVVDSMMTAQKHSTTIGATIVSGIGLLFGAAGVFGQLQDSLNTIWEVKSKPGMGIKGFIRQRFLSLAMVLGVGFLLLVSLALSAFLSASTGYIGGVVHMPAWVTQLLNNVVSFFVISLLFALIFKVLPDAKVAWKDVWFGAVGTALLFTAGKFLLGLYLGRESTTSAYGAGSAFVLILMYIYYSSLILFFGAEFTQVYAKLSGSPVVPKHHAVAVSERERENEGMSRDEKSKPRDKKTYEPIGEPAAAHRTRHDEFVERERRLQAGYVLSPVGRIKAQPYSFVGLALSAGIAAGVLLRFKSLRKALKVFASVQHLAKK